MHSAHLPTPLTVGSLLARSHKQPGFSNADFAPDACMQHEMRFPQSRGNLFLRHYQDTYHSDSHSPAAKKRNTPTSDSASPYPPSLSSLSSQQSHRIPIDTPPFSSSSSHHKRFESKWLECTNFERITLHYATPSSSPTHPLHIPLPTSQSSINSPSCPRQQ